MAKHLIGHSGRTNSQHYNGSNDRIAFILAGVTFDNLDM